MTIKSGRFLFGSQANFNFRDRNPHQLCPFCPVIFGAKWRNLLSYLWIGMSTWPDTDIALSGFHVLYLLLLLTLDLLPVPTKVMGLLSLYCHVFSSLFLASCSFLFMLFSISLKVPPRERAI